MYPLPKNVYSLRLASTLAITTHPKLTHHDAAMIAQRRKQGRKACCHACCCLALADKLANLQKSQKKPGCLRPREFLHSQASCVLACFTGKVLTPEVTGPFTDTVFMSIPRYRSSHSSCCVERGQLSTPLLREHDRHNRGRMDGVLFGWQPAEPIVALEPGVPSARVRGRDHRLQPHTARWRRPPCGRAARAAPQRG